MGVLKCISYLYGMELKNICKLAVLFVIINACKNTPSIPFSEFHYLDETPPIIEIYYPKVKSSSSIANKINKSLDSFACTVLSFNTKPDKKLNLQEAISDFKKEYNAYITLNDSLSKSPPLWEVFVNGELIFVDHQLASIAINTSRITGAKSSPLNFTFLNFNLETGHLLKTNEFINDLKAFSAIAKQYYIKEIKSKYTDYENVLRLNPFQLPKSLGFNEEGIIMFYDTFKTFESNSETLEFTLPYVVANPFLAI